MGEKLDKKSDTDSREPGRKVPEYQSEPETEDDVELASEDSFPASDPPSYTPINHPGKPEHERKRNR